MYSESQLGEGLNFEIWEWLAVPIYLVILFFIAYNHQKGKIETNTVYKYYTWGLIAKIGGGLFFGIIYNYYYQGGDTFSYFHGAVSMDKLLFQSPLGWFKNEFGSGGATNYSYFNDETGYPYVYMYNDMHTFAVIRFMNLIILPAFNSYLLATVIVAWFCYFGMWKMFLVFTKHYPNIQQGLAIGILFFPSVLFWGSGIMKDSITLSCTGWVTYSIYTLFILKKKRLQYTIVLIFNLFLILLVKPYIIFALLPGTLMWIFSERLYAIKNMAAKLIIIPVVILVSAGGGFAVLKSFGGVMGKFSVDKVMETAVNTQRDLKQDHYKGHAFDIGLTDASPSGLLKKSPEALIAGIYRPFLWESVTVVMLLSGLENTFILIITLYILRYIKFIAIYRRIIREPLLFFSLTYSLFFAFMVGLTTANFGALVRFKIAYLPFFISSLYIMYKGVLYVAPTDEEVIKSTAFIFKLKK